MIKEETRFASSTVFEGMTSIRALLDNLKNNVENARKIEKILFDKDKIKSKEKDFKYLTKMSEQFGFEIATVNAEEIDKITVGASHGGIVAICGEREYQKITKDKIKKNGFYVMVEGIEDTYNFGYDLR